MTRTAHPSHAQSSYRVRSDWGRTGAVEIGADADVVVLVDVLSFTTTLTVAVEAGISVLPFPVHDDTARVYAEEHRAVLAVRRSGAPPGEISLSPASVTAADAPARLVLPSPNGSAIAYELAARGRSCIGSCLRNTGAVVACISSRHPADSGVVAVIAAGEQWPDGALRPAAEDLWGAGAVIAGLAAAGWSNLSPEAQLARTAYDAVRGNEEAALLACASGNELVDRGYGGDVSAAAEVNASAAVPRLDGYQFRDFGGS